VSLLKPYLNLNNTCIGKKVEGLHQAIINSAIENQHLLEHIVPSGTTLLQGFTDELKTRLGQFCSNANVIEHNDRATLPWLGGQYMLHRAVSLTPISSKRNIMNMGQMGT
jgi:actin-related protein